MFDTINRLAELGHQICVIGHGSESAESDITPDDFTGLAEKLGCPVFHSNRFGGRERRLLTESRPDIAVSVNWPTLVTQRVIDLIPNGVLNAHAGDLPRYRGNACPNWAILNGEPTVTICIHEMSAELDAGPIHVRKIIALNKDTYISDVYTHLDRLIPEAFCEAVAAIDAGTERVTHQSREPSDSLRCFPRVQSDSRIDWSHDAESIARLVRASAKPFSGAYTHLAGTRVTIWKASADQLGYPCCGVPGQVVGRDQKSGNVTVLTGNGVLCLEEIQVAGYDPERPAARIKSLRTRLGLDMEARIEDLTQQIADLRDTVRALEGRGRSEMVT